MAGLAMTRDDIIRMAREAGFSAKHTDVYFDRQLERFAALVAAAERDRFADECIDIVARWGGSVEIEAAIRARGQQ